MSHLLSPCFHLLIACRELPFAQKLGDKFKRRKGFLSVKCVDTLADVEAEAKPESTLFILEDRVKGAQHLKDLKRFCDDVKKWTVLLLTEKATPDHVQAIKNMPFAGCMLRNTAGKEIEGGITIISEGEKFYSAQFADSTMGTAMVFPQYLDGFVNRESETFYYMCKRLTCKEMADKMELEEGTVRKYRSAVTKKVIAAEYKNVRECGRFFGLVED